MGGRDRQRPQDGDTAKTRTHCASYVADPSSTIALRSALYCLFARTITASRSLTIHLPRPPALVNVMPPPDDALRTCPLTLVSVALTVPIALFIEVFCLVYTYYKGIKNKMGEPWSSSPSGTTLTRCCRKHTRQW